MISAAEAMTALTEGTSRYELVTPGALSAPLETLESRLRTAVGPALVAELCAELFRAGGKRLRPLAALATASALEVEREPALRIAEVAELTHGASLLHDDVIDEADTRRGQAAARRRWSNTLSILGGDYLLVRSLQRLLPLGCEPLLQYYIETLERLLGAEAAQHVAKRSGDLSVEGYLEISEGKTGGLFGFACAAPARLLGDAARAERLDRFGRQVGVTFQIADDNRDLLALDPGKPATLDLTDGVPSLPIRCAAALDGEIRAFLRRAGEVAPTPEEVVRMTERLRATPALERSVALGREHLARARDDLAALEPAQRFGAHRGVCDWLENELSLQERQL